MSSRTRFSAVMVIMVLVGVLGMQGVLVSQVLKEKKRIFIYTGGGYAFSKVVGPYAELGVDVEVFPKIYLRGMVDYYSKPDVKNSGGKSDYAYGLNVILVYKVALSDLLNFNVSVGGHQTTVSTTVLSSGVSIKVSEAYKGISGGLSMEYQLSNRWYFHFGGGAKYMKSPVPGTWIKLNGGFLFRVK